MNIKNRTDFHLLLKKHNCKTGIELGVGSGRYSEHLINSHDFTAFYSVDSWNSRAHLVDQYIDAYNRLKIYNNAYIYRASFEEVFNTFEDNYFDFIYIDGYAHNGSDLAIEQWYSKLKVGGIYSGHDYIDENYPGRDSKGRLIYEKYLETKQAVDVLCRDHNKQINLTSADKYPSWWLIK
tara:strand:+ start:2537 stop:3076 length:540 start_codon:yes stop_codon:yes gene_type:complete